MKNTIQNIRKKIHFWFEDVETPMGFSTDLLIVFLIFVVSIIFVIKTYPHSAAFTLVLDSIENIIVGFFIFEYVVRLWASPDRVREFFKIYTLVDLLAIIPFFFDNDSYQVLRVFRALRVLRLMRYMQGHSFFFKKFNKTHIIITRIAFILSSIIFVSSGIIFFAEKNYPGSNIHTFFDAVYFTIITLTTVGYGDITPKSDYSRLITILMVFSGIIFIPYQIKELLKQFVSGEKLTVVCNCCDLEKHDSDANYCKKCGSEIDIKVIND